MKVPPPRALSAPPRPLRAEARGGRGGDVPLARVPPRHPSPTFEWAPARPSATATGSTEPRVNGGIDSGGRGGGGFLVRGVASLASPPAEARGSRGEGGGGGGGGAGPRRLRETLAASAPSPLSAVCTRAESSRGDGACGGAGAGGPGRGGEGEEEGWG